MKTNIDDQSQFGELLRKIEDDLNNVYGACSMQYSTISRTIVFGLIALVWGLCYIDHQMQPLDLPKAITICLLVSYLIVDMLQYLCIVLRYKKHFNDINCVLKVDIPNYKDFIVAETESRNNIHKSSYKYFIIKSIILLMGFTGTIVIVAQMFVRG